MTQTLFSHKMHGNSSEFGSAVRPSNRLRGLVRRYFEVLDGQERPSNLPPAVGSRKRC